MNALKKQFQIFSAALVTIAVVFSGSAMAASNGNSNGKGNGKGNGNSTLVADDAGVQNGNGKSQSNSNKITKKNGDETDESIPSETIESGQTVQVEEAAGTQSEVDSDEVEDPPENDESEKEGSGPGKGKEKENVIGKGSRNFFGNNGNSNSASDGIKGRVITNKDIVYTGQPLEIGLHFAQGAQLIHEGIADAYLVIFSPLTDSGEEPGLLTDGPTDVVAMEADNEPEVENEPALSDAIVVPVSDEADTEIVKMFSIPQVDLSGVAAGTYQLGLILTIPGGNPLVINDWYNGLLGLVDIVGLTISAEAVEGDEDGDGMLDCGTEPADDECDLPAE